MNVKKTFLNGTINEEACIEKIKGFEINSRKIHFCVLKKALYGLTQVLRALYAKMDAYLLRIRFVKSYIDANIDLKIVKNELGIKLLYADDLFITGVERIILECNLLAAEFEMKDLRLMLVGFPPG